MSETKLECCYMACEEEATWEMYDEGGNYMDTYVHSCDEHLPELLNIDTNNIVYYLKGE